MQAKHKQKSEKSHLIAQHSRPSFSAPLTDSVTSLANPDHNSTLTTVQQSTVSQEEEHEIDLPLPPPEILAAYEAANPKFAEHLLESLLSEQVHRRELEKKSHAVTEKFMLRGQVFQLTIALAAMAAAVGLGIYGSATAATVIAAFPVATIVVAVIGRMSKDPRRAKSVPSK